MSSNNALSGLCSTEQPTPRPVFLYGTLRALPFFAWVLTGDPSKVDQVLPLTEPATLTGFACLSVEGKDYPALIRHDPSSAVDGLILRPQTQSQRRKLDDFEGETYSVTPVTVIVKTSGIEEQIDADVYVWNGEARLSRLPWDLEVFKRDRLDDWLDLFSGMELVG